MKRRIERAKNAKLYLLQQAGPNTFIIAGGESQSHRHKVTIGTQVSRAGWDVKAWKLTIIGGVAIGGTIICIVYRVHCTVLPSIYF